MTRKQSVDSLSNYQLYTMLLNGELHDRIGYGVKYMAIIERLVAAGYDVAKYKHRVISGLGNSTVSKGVNDDNGR